MAATTTTNRTTADFDDVFQEFRLDLEQEGQDLEQSLFNSKIDVLERSIRDQPQRRACRVLFGIDYSDYTDKEFLLNKIPGCLLSSSASFRAAFFGQLQHEQQTLNPVVVEQLTVLHYRMSIIDFHKRLWDAYLRSGTGQMENIDPSQQNDGDATLHYWPPMISPLMRTKAAIQITSNHDGRTDSVKQYLAQLDHRTDQYRAQLDAIKTDMPSSSEELFHEIEHFVHEQTLLIVKIYFEAVIALMKYDYVDRLLQLQYGHQQPTEKQIGLAARICQLAFAKDKAEKEHCLFQIGVYHKKIPLSIYLSERHLPSMITTISDLGERARLTEEYLRASDRAKADLTTVMMSASNVVKQAAQKQFNETITKIGDDQHRLPKHKRLSAGMLRLIEQRQTNITQCLQYIFEFKAQFSLHVPPTFSGKA